jgi:hypothetical protein
MEKARNALEPETACYLIELMRTGFIRSRQFWNTKCARSCLISDLNIDDIAELKHRKQESARLDLIPGIHILEEPKGHRNWGNFDHFIDRDWFSHYPTDQQGGMISKRRHGQSPEIAPGQRPAKKHGFRIPVKN